ncbi:MAG TPA: nucleoside kinase, partial [Candidatus Binatia bacterium]|nr:nucleoside kinase [Candidatus Binatia bacterium]
MPKITLTLPDGSKIETTANRSLHEISRDPGSGARGLVLAAKLDGQLCPLDTPAGDSARLEWVTYADKPGLEIYQRSASFILNMAVAELYYNTRLVIGHSISNGFYYDFYCAIPVTQELLNEITAKMHEISDRDLVFRRRLLPRDEAIRYLRERSLSDSRRLVENSAIDQVQIYESGPFANIEIYPLAYSTGAVSRFELRSYSPGFVILFPEQDDFIVNSHIGKTRKLFQIYQESKNWGKILGVSDVGRLDQIIAKGHISELIKVAEGLHEKKIARIADTLLAKKEDVRLVLVAGPSASGKTTFSKRLSTQLQVNGIRPLALSMDNYFVDRESCPRDENGDLDFEALGALDLVLFNRHLADLLEGREVAVPRFNFETGRRKDEHQTLWLEDDQILVVEGIHALNPKISALVPEQHKFRIYVSALTQLTINDHSRISTTDTRILRRLVRDSRFRNYSAAETLKRFPSVIRGERRNTFPFQETADTMLNSWLVYELAVLRDLALPLLEKIGPDDETYTEAQRLLKFLMLFRPVAADEVPPTSILREFIGGSSFRY